MDHSPTSSLQYLKLDKILGKSLLNVKGIWSVKLFVNFTWNFPCLGLQFLQTSKGTKHITEIHRDHGQWGFLWSSIGISCTFDEMLAHWIRTMINTMGGNGDYNLYRFPLSWLSPHYFETSLSLLIDSKPLLAPWYLIKTKACEVVYGP